MSTATAHPARPARLRLPRRLPELVLVGAGVAAALVTMGGFTLVMNHADADTVETVIMPALTGGAAGPGADALTMGKTLAAWLGASLVVLLLLVAAGTTHMLRRPASRRPAWWLLAAGLVCLLGSQLVLYPVAFLFLLAAAVIAVPPPPEVCPR